MDTKGRLEVCYDGYWGSVCRDNDRTIAGVVCRQLGYFATGQWNIYIYIIEDHTYFGYIHTFIFPGRIFSVYEYQAPPIPTTLDRLGCTGNESSLLDCCHIGGRHNCYSTIGIECAGSAIYM